MNWGRSCRLIKSTISASPLKSIPENRSVEKIRLRMEVELVELPVTGAGVCSVSMTDTEDLGVVERVGTRHPSGFSGGGYDPDLCASRPSPSFEPPCILINRSRHRSFRSVLVDCDLFSPHRFIRHHHPKFFQRSVVSQP